MAKNLLGQDTAQSVISGTFSGTGNSAALVVDGAERPFGFLVNVEIQGVFSATLQLQRSLDGGATFVPVALFGQSSPLSITAPISFTHRDAERNAQYRVACTAYTSGTPTYRLSR